MADHRRGANLPALGGFNRIVVLDAVRRSDGGLSRVEIAERTGLSPQTVSNVTRFLLDERMIVESGTINAGRGKPRTLLRLDPRSRFAIGVHVDPAVVSYVLLDLDGSIMAETSTSTPSAADPDGVIATMTAAVGELTHDAAVSPKALLGIGVASPGPIDADAGVVLDPPFLPRWRDVPLRDAFARATGLPVLLEKDVIAAAVGEMFLAGEAAARNFAFVYYGTGFGVGLVVNHEPVRGVGSNAGDAGHIVIQRGSLAGLGDSDFGEIGDSVAPARVVRLAAQRGLDLGAGDPNASVDDSWSGLGRLIAGGDPTALDIADSIGSAIGRAAVVIVNLLDLDRVVVGGPFWSRIADAALPAAARTVMQSPLLIPKHPVAVSDSALGAEVAAVGAACLVLDSALSPRASSLLIDD